MKYDKEKERARKAKQRMSHPLVSPCPTPNVPPPDNTEQDASNTLTRPNMMGPDGPIWKDSEYDPNETLPDGRKRYLKTNDTQGQVLDRLSVPGGLG